jgi:hypothetical protein
VIEEAVGLQVERRDGGDLLVVEFEIKDCEVFGHALLAHGFRDGLSPSIAAAP